MDDEVDYDKLYGRNIPIDEEMVELGRREHEFPKVRPYVNTEIRHGKRNWEVGIKGEF